MWTISGSVEVWTIISPCYPGDGDMEELLGPASRDHPSVNLLMGDRGLDTALAEYWIQWNKVLSPDTRHLLPCILILSEDISSAAGMYGSAPYHVCLY